ncbi:hypothetical protein BDQ17DRAFT_915765 [Cyathus striatus]|nr:hypothetical protein BDQ17DRAFT_915765 [Cyathus striatus]
MFQNAHNFVIQSREMNTMTQPTVNNISILRTTANFIGQEQYLEKLHNHFNSNENNERKMFLLHGMGGIGKTQICLKFIDESISQFSYIFWIDSTSENTVVQSLKNIYNEIINSCTYISSISIDEMLHWITSLKGKWLMIFDNADASPELVEKYIPPGNMGNILITSRNPAIKGVVSTVNSMEVKEMTEISAAELLFQASGLNNRATIHQKLATEIVTELYCLPLAIVMAGSYIMKTECNLEYFLEVYYKHRPHLMNIKTYKGASKYKKTIYGTWEIAFQNIINMSNSGDTEIATVAKYATKLISVFAFFHHESISETIFKRAAKYYKINKCTYNKIPTYLPRIDPELLAITENGEWNEALFVESLELLLSFSLIKRMSMNLYNLHPLVQEWCQGRLSLENKNIWEWNARAVIVCSVTDEESTAEYIYQNSLLTHILQNLINEKDINTMVYYEDIFQTLANIFKKATHYTLEEKLRLRILDFYQQFYGENHSNTVVSMINLACTYENQHKWTKAEEFQLQAVELSRRHFNHDNLQMLTNMSSLVYTYKNQGRWRDAEELQLKVLDMSSRILGADHFDTINNINKLVNIYVNQGKWAEAEELEIQILEIRNRIFGIENCYTLIAMSNLAYMYINQNKWTNAEELQLKMLEICCRTLGTDHPNTLSKMSNLATTYWNQGKRTEAESLLQEVLHKITGSSGTEHIITPASFANSACMYQHKGSLISIEKLSANHHDTLKRMNNLALIYQKQGKWKKAENFQNGVQKCGTNIAEDKSENIEELENAQRITLVHDQMLFSYAHILASTEALSHARKHANSIMNIFRELNVMHHQIFILSGFNEYLLEFGIGYLQEVHIFSTEDIDEESQHLNTLSKVASPYPLKIFTPSKVINVALYDQQGNYVDMEDYILQKAIKQATPFCAVALEKEYSDMIIYFSQLSEHERYYKRENYCNDDRFLHQNKDILELSQEHFEYGASTSHIDSSSSGPLEYNRDHNAEHNNYNKDTNIVGNLLVEQSAYRIQDNFNTGTSVKNETYITYFKALGEVNADGYIITDFESSELSLVFTKLNFNGIDYTSSELYQQFGFRILVDTKCDVTFINKIWPTQTKFSKIQNKEKQASNEIISDEPKFELKKFVGEIEDHITEGSNHTFKILHSEEKGVLIWWFEVDDKSDRPNYINLQHELLPRAKFNYKLGSIPSFLTIEISAYWSLIQTPLNNHLTRNVPGGNQQNKFIAETKYSNLCQIVALRVHLVQLCSMESLTTMPNLIKQN